MWSSSAGERGVACFSIVTASINAQRSLGSTPTPTPRGTNSGSGTRGTREGGERREGGNTRQDLGGVEGTHDQP